MRTKWDGRTVTAPVSLVVSAFASLDDVRGTLTPQLQRGETTLILVDLGQGRRRLGGSMLAQVTGQLHHPSIVPVHELGTLPDGKQYFTMKLVRGITLDAWLARELVDDPARPLAGEERHRARAGRRAERDRDAEPAKGSAAGHLLHGFPLRRRNGSLFTSSVTSWSNPTLCFQPKAARAFEAALRINPGYTDAALNLAVTYNDTGHYKEAQEAYRHALAHSGAAAGKLDRFVQGKLANMYAEIAAVYLSSGLYPDAIREYRKALDLGPKFVDIRAALAALEALAERLPVSQADVRRGLHEVALPGRFQVLPGRPTVVLDVAHNPHAARAFAANGAAGCTRARRTSSQLSRPRRQSTIQIHTVIAATTGIEPETYNWGVKRLTIDLLGEYYFTRRLALFANLRNIGDATEDLEIAGPSTPPHAQFRQREDFGSLWTVGLKGTF